jgi:hypothetical protein
VPAYNEERNIGRVVDELRAFDRGSRSSSSRRLGRPHAQVAAERART